MKKTALTLSFALMTSTAAMAATGAGFAAPEAAAPAGVHFAQANVTQTDEPTLRSTAPDTQGTDGPATTPPAGASDDQLTEEGDATNEFGDSAPDSQVLQEGQDGVEAGESQVILPGQSDDELTEEGDATNEFGDSAPTPTPAQ
jgi:hypothetical protein